MELMTAADPLGRRFPLRARASQTDLQAARYAGVGDKDFK
jgi:hypothetical protein